MTTISRRDLLRALAVVPAAAAYSHAAPRRTIGIVGAGMSGVSLAWLLDGYADVVLLEARDQIGGNVRSATVDVDGEPVAVDMGAQYFHPRPYPAYSALLVALGLAVPANGEPSPIHGFPATFTLTATGQFLPRFVTPALPDRAWPVLAAWNWSGLFAFLIAFVAAKAREDANERWDLTIGEWLPTLGLSREQWEGMLLPWAASLGSGDIEQTRELSARAVFVFAAKALSDNPFDPLIYYTLRPGLVEVLRRMLSETSTVTLATNAGVEGIRREPHGGFTLRCTRGRSFSVDDVVFASSGPSTLKLLRDLPGTYRQQAALGGVEFYDARLSLHTDAIYAPIPAFRSFLNCGIDGGFCEASMWMGPVLTDASPAAAARLYKSWTTHRTEQPAEVLYETSYRHVLASVATLKANARVAALQGYDRLWFAGGYLTPYDSQETALLSALSVAQGLHVASPRALMLKAALTAAV